MKKMKLAALSLALIGILTSGNALAADTATINVSATVLGTCLFNTGTYNMAFGAIDPSIPAGDRTASVNLDFTCSNGTTWTIDDESFATVGAKSMLGAVTAGSLAYQIDNYTLSGTGTGNPQSVTVPGRILQATYMAAAADVYTDTFTIDINP